MIKHAVIPTAGYGTRLFPLTKVIPKAFVPIIDDGVTIPAILHLVEEALSAGVEHVTLVISPGHRAIFEAFFHAEVPYLERLKLEHTQAEARVLAAGRHVTLVEQIEPLGFGHAVACARDAVRENPFLLILGDHLYRTSAEKSCAAQVVEAYRGHSVIALHPIPIEKVTHSGVIGGEWDGGVLHITQMAEKPSLAYAREHLHLDGGGYLAATGQYVLAARVFALLEAQIADGALEHGEIHMTTALDALARAGDLDGLIVEGETFDTGHPERYAEAFTGWVSGGSSEE